MKHMNSKIRSSRLLAIVLGTALSCVAVPFANAGQGNVNFGGNVDASSACIIVIRGGGTMTQSATGDQISSKNTGGNHGVADVYSWWNYDISLDAPSFFTSRPTGGDDNVTFTASFSGTSIFRGRSFADQPGSTSVQLRRGPSVTRVQAHLTADRPDAFPSGNYSAYTILRCE
ncbi:MAG: hypothetical protein QM488_09025 [Rhizobiaceae bacterium]